MPTKPPYITSYNFPMNFYDRPEVAISNILRGNYPASVKAIFTPDQLSPEERKTLGEKYKKDPVLKGLVEIVSNPLVILGVVLSMRYPVLRASKMFTAAKLGKTAASDLTWLSKTLSIPDHLFAKNPRVPKAMHEVGIRASEFKNRLFEQYILPVADKFKGLLGIAPKKEHEIAVHYILDGGEHVGGYVNRTLAPWIKKWGGPDLKNVPFLNQGALERYFPAKEIKAIKDSARIARGGYDDAAGMMTLTREGITDPAVLKALRDNNFVSSTYHATDVGRIAKGGKRTLAPGAKLKDYVIHRMKGARNVLDDLPPDAGVPQRFKDVVTPHMARRHGAMIPDLDDIALLNKQYPGLINEQWAAQLPKMKADWSVNFQNAVNRVYDQSTPKTLKQNLQNLLQKEYKLPDEVVGPITERAVFHAKQAGMPASRVDILRHTKNVGELPEYTTRAFEDFMHYTHAVAPTYASTVIPKGMKQNWASVLREELQTLEAVDPLRAGVLRKSYLPMVTGRLTEKQAFRQLAFQNMKQRYYDTLQVPEIKKFFNKVPGGEKVRAGLAKILSEEGTLTGQAMNAKITSWLYFGAMGINPSPAIKNLMQPLLTTVPLLGWPATISGMGRLLPQLGRYSQAIKKYHGQGKSWQIADDMAVSEVWPEFHRRGLHNYPEYAAELTEAAVRPWAQGAEKWIQGAKRGGMAMFTATERFNRLLSWEAGMVSAARTEPMWFAGGQIADDAFEFAAHVVRRTQFPSGVMGIPHGMLNVPSPLRQFTQFPLRMMDFLASSTKYGGANRRDFGTVGRALLYSTVGYQALKRGVGVDVSESTLMGALPAPLWKEAPFYPFPLVPPALSMAGGTAQAIYSDDYSRMPQTLAVAVPGGLAMQRAWKTLRPASADYSQYEKTGTIPIYDRNGRYLADKTPAQLFMRSIGIRTTDERAEVELVNYLSKQKEQLREYRLMYLKALAENNLRKAEQIQAEYKKRYPELGPLQVKKSDIQTIQRNRQMNRIERVMRSMPTEYRDLFGGMTAMAGAETLSRGMEATKPGP